MYHAMELDRDHSLQLFSLHAFRETRPPKDYEELSEKVVDYCKGLPLALKIMGSHLFMRDKAVWEIDIALWRNILHSDSQGKLVAHILGKKTLRVDKHQGQRRKRIEMARWTLLLTNLIIEMASAVFDQLGNELLGIVLAFVALLLSTAELLIHMARKERMSLLPISHRSSSGTSAPGKPVGTIVEYFGLVGAVWQCFYSTVAYARQKKDNPIKTCLLHSIFLLCAVISNLIKKEFIDENA